MTVTNKRLTYQVVNAMAETIGLMVVGINGYYIVARRMGGGYTHVYEGDGRLATARAYLQGRIDGMK